MINDPNLKLVDGKSKKNPILFSLPQHYPSAVHDG